MVYWVWKCNGGDKKEIRHQDEVVIADSVQHFPQTATRLQLKAIRIEMNRIHSLSPAKHNARLKAALALVNPSLANTAITGQLQTSLEYLLAYDSDNLLHALQYGGAAIDSTSFDPFWTTVKIQVDKYGGAVHSRRDCGSSDHVNRRLCQLKMQLHLQVYLICVLGVWKGRLRLMQI